MNGEGRAVRPTAALPDLVYPVKPTEDDCAELRYSLRSIAANAAGLFRKVWIVGSGLPAWLTNVETIDAGSPDGRNADVRAKITAAVHDRRVATRIVILADDNFLVEPITEWAAFHMGPTTKYLERLGRLKTPLHTGNSGWVRAVAATAAWMADRGHGDILCRQGHRPLLWDRRALAEAIDAYPADQPMDYLGFYDIAGAAGEGRRGVNAKVTVADNFQHRLDALNVPWLSSNDRSFREGMIGGYIRGMFREPSPYERED
jgi:hypothetical protein